MPEPAKVKMLKTIASFLERCEGERFTGALCLELNYQEGGVRQVSVQRTEKLQIKEK